MTGSPTPDTPGIDLRLVPAALTCWTVTAVGVWWGPWAAVAGVVVAVAAVLGVGIRVGAARWSVVFAVAAVGTAFAIVVALRVHAVQTHPLASRFGSTVTVTVTPSESPRPIRGGRLMFAASLQKLQDVESSGRVLVFAPADGYSEVAAGRPMAFRARAAAPKRRDLSVAVLTAVGAPRFGTASTGQRAAAQVRADFADEAQLTLTADQAAILPGLVLGDVSAVDSDTTAAFKRAGLTHLTAVSGANVTIVCGAVLLSAVVVGPRVAVGLAAVTLFAFVVIVQPQPSVLRAAAMGSVMLMGILVHRRRQAIPALSASVLVLMVISPALAVDAGFALSVVATAALVVIAPVWSRFLVGRGCPKLIADAVCVAVAAQLVTAPLVAAISGSLSLVAVLANLLVAPVIPPITIIGTAAAAVGWCWPAVAQLLIRFTGPELWWLLQVARWSAALPGAAVSVPSGWGGALLLSATTVGVALVVVWWRRRRRGRRTADAA
ncbi:ComEC/Rec2 family competence protein [Mycobacterium sp. CBMA293]|uniref:ComEC/Rec2 family competence protein n=2 Tax=Mycolicibacterium TaxID=1866885 RepID=UPI0013247051|nr:MULTISPECIES: ComEC/Rec2 family competence protein [unclassified Mycolicibacterium]MUL49234.1 ComEC/Rec2 family competence protein [Mycolicibacterium sp. CBMA 360]MUL95673.1 ComEC/Rec2 family competence protein [Mycolicibacterium sp. CBMA 230]MUL60732.1 ComEC/Rec2 family competence protein [Mycolicibacterium sp. CBMA 335]MUL71745.1 ComEC/Rec2 family competence protein [Mycolicibacterium sp. CBMA 311]MUM03585.1 competence protein [Mycolicibacterium sp. CBMA 213]